jgi:hypothetical protein
MEQIVPNIDEDVSLPANAKEAFPELTPAQELEMRANTIKLMSDLTGTPLVPTKENSDAAVDIAKQMVSNPKLRPDFAKYPNETLAMLAGMVAQMNVSIVEELSDFKLYVVNKLVQEVETAKDSKSRIAAIRSLGEIDGVDAFKRRSEVTHKIMSIEEVEEELLLTLSNLEDKIIDVEARDIVAQEVKNGPGTTQTDA